MYRSLELENSQVDEEEMNAKETEKMKARIVSDAVQMWSKGRGFTTKNWHQDRMDCRSRRRILRRSHLRRHRRMVGHLKIDVS